MIAPFATLAFLAILWIAASILAETFGRAGTRVVAALRGATPAAAVVTSRVTTRARRSARSSRPLRARPQLRAAA